MTLGRTDVTALRRELSEANELVRAIRAGEVDAFVLGENDSYRIHALQDADTPYRVLVEAMRQGAATVTGDGTVLYANRRLRDLVGLRAEEIVGQPITRCLGVDPLTFESLLAQTLGAETRQEIDVRAGDAVVPVLVSAYALPNRGSTPTYCLVITDLTERKVIAEREAAFARERAALGGIFSRLPFAVFVVDAGGDIAYLNENAGALLSLSGGVIEPVRKCAAAVLASAGTHCEQVTLSRDDGTTSYHSIHANAVRIPGHPERAVVVVTDVTAEHEASARREENERFRDMFVGILGHDLRAPLQVVVNAATLLKSTASTPEQTKFLNFALRAAQRMSRLIEDMLDMTLSRLGGGVPITRAEIDLGDVVASTIEEFGEDNRFVVHFEGDTSGSWDRARLAQVLSNLLSNAVKYGTASEPVHVRIDGSDPSSVKVEVYNRGEPIPADLLPVIFDPFRRGGNGTRRNAKGIGLGLFIAEQIVRSHGGTISVRSSREEGTTFSLSLPRGEKP